MKNNRTILYLVAILALTGIMVPAHAQQVSIPDPELNDAIRQTLQKFSGPLTEQDMLQLTTLSACCRNITKLQGLEAARNLTRLSLDRNLLTDFSVASGWTNLLRLDLSFNSLTNVSIPGNLTNLITLLIEGNQLTSLNLPDGLGALARLDLDNNRLTHFTVPSGMKGLASLSLAENQLTSFTLPAGLTNLATLSLSENQLTNLVLPTDLNLLESFNVGDNRLTSLNLPSGLTQLTGLFFANNQLTNVTLPPDMTLLASLKFLGNPLTTFVLPEPLAVKPLAEDVASLKSQGVSVFTYPLTIQLVRVRQPIGAFQFAITGPPGAYTILASADLTSWSPLAVVTNSLGAIVFTDVTAHLTPRKFYRALLQSPPANMVFIPPNTFLMGSPTSEVDRSSNEGPQTTVILSRGFWIGQYEVTQGEYLSVMNTNPSIFPGDLSRPVSSVTWLDATNYCTKLTQRELAAGRIPAGSHFRLPTEAEWECAARAGTSTRFSYGDDPGYPNLTTHAWYASNSGIIVHPVGQKLSNPWELYDMEGNVGEWCQDWFGLLPGGVQTDPTGPATSASGRKVTRGGAYDNSEQSCRSAARFFFPAGAFLTDSALGFRVVLVTEPQ